MTDDKFTEMKELICSEPTSDADLDELDAKLFCLIVLGEEDFAFSHMSSVRPDAFTAIHIDSGEEEVWQLTRYTRSFDEMHNYHSEDKDWKLHKLSLNPDNNKWTCEFIYKDGQEYLKSPELSNMMLAWCHGFVQMKEHYLAWERMIDRDVVKTLMHRETRKKLEAL